MISKAEEIKRRYCMTVDNNCWNCPFNREEYYYSEADEEGDYYDHCNLEEPEAIEALQKMFDLYLEYKDKPVEDPSYIPSEDYCD